jgi:death-on-curing protein
VNTAFKIGQPCFLSVEDVLTLHRMSVGDYGGVDGLTEMGRLESAIAVPAQGIAGEFAHEFPFGMAAAYGFHLAMNHPFRDGNKRTALAAMVAFLRMNGWNFVIDDPRSADVILELIEQHRTKQWLADRLVAHSRARVSFELRDFFAAITYEADMDALRSLAASGRSVEFDAALVDATATMPALGDLVNKLVTHLDDENEAMFIQVGTQIIVYLRLYRLAEDMGYEW